MSTHAVIMCTTNAQLTQTPPSWAQKLLKNSQASYNVVHIFRHGVLELRSERVHAYWDGLLMRAAPIRTARIVTCKLLLLSNCDVCIHTTI